MKKKKSLNKKAAASANAAAGIHLNSEWLGEIHSELMALFSGVAS